MTNEFAIPRSVEWKETYIRILNQQKLPDVTESEWLHERALSSLH